MEQLMPAYIGWPASGSDRPVTVSIITPSYNQGAFLAETLESVVSQSGNFFLDYIVVDGGSTDNSVDILKQLDEQINTGGRRAACRGITFRWTSEPDGGQADGVNRGFAQARGEIIGWLNSDDTYLPGALATIVSQFQDHPTDVMVYGNALFIDKTGNITGSYPSEPFSLKRLSEKCIVCQPAAFFRAGILEKVGFLDVTLQASMDYDLWIRMGRAFEQDIAFIDTCLATSRMYPENKTYSIRTRVHKENTALLHKYFGYVGGEWIVSCFYDIYENRKAVPAATSLALVCERLFVLRYLLNIRSLLSLGVFLGGNLHKLFHRCK